MRVPFVAAILVLAGGVLLSAQRQAQTITGMVVEVKPSERVLVISHDPVPGVMPAMIMPFEVRNENSLRGLTPGTIVSFTVRANAEAAYAKEWKADAARWHFLTGSSDDIKRVADMFGMDYFPDEGLINHSLRTVVIDRAGRLIANVEGNRFTAQQLGDLVSSALVR